MIILTGATGFVGQYVINELIKKELKFICICRKIPPWTDEIDKNIRWIEQEQLFELSSINIEEPITGIIHLAGMVNHTRNQDSTIYNINVGGTDAAVELAKKNNCRIVIASTSGVLPNSNKLLNEKESPNENNILKRKPNWPYYDSKIMSELKEDYENIVWLRPSMIFGPGLYSHPRSLGTIEKYIKKKYPIKFHGGVNYIDVRDLAPLFVEALNNTIPNGSYNIGGTNETLIDFFNRLEKISKIAQPKLTVPWWLAWIVCTIMAILKTYITSKLPTLPDPVKIEMGSSFWNINSSKARQLLKLEVRDPNKTLLDTIKYLQNKC